MSCISHVNVIQLEGICIEKESPWIVMELLKGEDFYTALTDPFHLDQVLSNFLSSFDVAYLRR